MKIVNVAQMRRIEQAADAGGHSYHNMMEFAGHAVATACHALIAPNVEAPVLVLVGPGNNGGDGVVAARYLMEFGHPITLYIWKRDTRRDDNFHLLKRKRRGVTIWYADNDPDLTRLREELRQADVVVDALLGVGITRPIEGRLAEILKVAREELEARRNPSFAEGDEPGPNLLRFPVMETLSLGLNLEHDLRPAPDGFEDDDFEDDEFEGENAEIDEESDEETEEEAAEEPDEEDEEWQAEDEEPSMLPWPRPTIVAVDCPSGLNCDTGALDAASLAADLTITFALPKWGHLQHPGAAACGLLAVADIGIASELSEDVRTELIEWRQVSGWLPNRPPDAHKGTFGRALIAAGSLNYTGAAYLSSLAALRAGAGLVTLAVPAPLHAVLAAALPEITWLPLAGGDGVHNAAGAAKLLAAAPSYDALLVGPGLTTGEDARAFIAAVFGSGGLDRTAWRGRLVVDADALNILATETDWPARLPPSAILTPHPGEMARLTGASPAEINAGRIETAQRFAEAWGHIVVLKGAHTVIAEPGGRTAVLPFAMSVLATAGSGDVLAGAIVAMLAQGLPPYEAAVCGAYLHGQAGLIVLRGQGGAGAVARDFIAHFPEALRNLYTGR